MHYQNGRLAQPGDPVIGRGYHKEVFTGTIHSLVPGSTSCNCQVASIVPGGVNQVCSTIDALLHADDVLEAYEKGLTAVVPPQVPKTPSDGAPAPG